MDDGHVLKKALKLEAEGQRKNRKPKMTWKKQVDEESMLTSAGKMHYADQSGSLAIIRLPLY